MKKCIYLLLACVLFMSSACSVNQYTTVENKTEISSEESETDATLSKNETSSAEIGADMTSEAETTTTEAETRDPEVLKEAAVEKILNEMTLEEKIAQLFVIRPETLSCGAKTSVTEELRENYEKYPVGGFIFMGENIVDPKQTLAFTGGLSKIAEERTGLKPLLSVDEEGGLVRRINRNESFNLRQVGPMRDIGASGDTNLAYSTCKYIGSYLKFYGFNLDFAPVADIYTNPANTVIGSRAFGTEPDPVSEMVSAALRGLQDGGVCGTLKHFPGHGGTAGDTHEGFAFTNQSREALYACELKPFQAAMEAGAQFIMAAHIACPKVTGSNTPASLSSVLLTDILRNEMGYNGIIITDSLEMGAITGNYDSASAAVRAIRAGADLILMPQDFGKAYQGVLDAVADGRVSKERIDESVRRILRVKTDL